MKKVTILFLLMMFLWAGSSWGTTVQVGSGSATSVNFPITAYYGYSYTQQIYTKAQISTLGTITKLRFYVSAGFPVINSGAWVIYLGHTSKTAFSSTTNWEALANLTKVFDGTVTFPSVAGWVEITLTTPFNYNNVDNLIVAVDENTPSFADANVSWLSFTSGSNTGIYYRNDNTNPNPSSPPTATGRSSNINQIQFEFEALVPCSGTPVPGNTITSSNPVCSGGNFILSLQNATPGTGVTYQWQSSPNGNDPWTNFGTSTATATTSQTAATYYRCQVTCSGNTGTSTPVLVAMIGVPWVENFEATLFPPGCWSISPNSGTYYWVRSAPSAYGVGGFSAYLNLYNISAGAAHNLNTLGFDIGASSNAYVQFDHAYATYTGGEVDKLEIYYSTDDGGNFKILETLLGGPTGPLNTYGGTGMTSSSFIPTSSQWATKLFQLPAGTNKLQFKAVSAYGNNLYLDNIEVFIAKKVSGIVTSTMTGNPIEGASVKVGNYPALTTLADGSYETFVKDGTYTVVCSATGFNPKTTADVVVAADLVLNIALTNPTMDINPLSVTENLPYGGTGTQQVTITNNGDGPLSWNGTIDYGTKNPIKESTFIKNVEGLTAQSDKIPPTNSSNATDGVLWDNTNIDRQTNGIISSDLTGLVPDGRVITADDFIVPAFETWTINNVYTEGFSLQTILPNAFAVEFYTDNGGKPGTMIYTEDIVPAGINFTTQNLNLTTPLVLGSGHYWVSVYGVFIGGTSVSTTRWNWYTGALPIGNEAALNDFAGLFGIGSGWFYMSQIGVTQPSCYFILNGDKTVATPWVSADETSGSILPGESKAITLSFDANRDPGIYQANFNFSSNPNVGQVQVPVTLNVLTAVSGVVTNANTGMPVANAQVTFAGYPSVFTGADGAYTINILPGNYTAIVQALAYCDLEITKIDVGGFAFVQDFAITAPLFAVAPDPVVKDIDFETVSTSLVTLSNPGTCDLPFVVSESSAWLTIAPLNGIIPAGGNVVLTFTYNAAGLAYGGYQTVVDFDLDLVADQSVNVTLNVTQEVQIPAANNWGGVSTYMDYSTKGAVTMEALLAEIKESIVILVGEEGIYWPGQNINTFPGGLYNNLFGYKIKMSAEDELFFEGTPLVNKTVSFSAGTHIVPVLRNTPIAATTLFAGKPIEFAFGYDGSIYWPAGGITTLQTLLPGFGYLVKFTAPATLNFGGTKGDVLPNNPPVFVNTTSWNDVIKTGDVHVIGISPEACAELIAGDVIGVFNQSGLCTGMAQYFGNSQSFAVIAYGDDPTTSTNDGMSSNEPLMVKIFRNGMETSVNPVYNTQMPNADGLFANDGLSQITVLKVGALSVGENQLNNVSIYPNPSSGIFNINITKVSKPIDVSVTNSQGQVIYTGNLNGSQQIDLSSQPKGVYFIRLVSDNTVKLEKLVVK